MSRDSRRLVLTGFLLFLVALGVRLGTLADGADHPGFSTPIVDASYYDLAARQLVDPERHGPTSEVRLFWQPFLYPRLLAAIYALGGDLLAVKVLQALLGALTAVGTFWLGQRRLGYGAGLAAGLVVAFYGPLVLFEGELLAAGVAAFEAVALLLLLDWAGERIGAAQDGRSSPKVVILAGLAVGGTGAVAVLTRPTFLPFVTAAGLWLGFRAWRSRKPRGWRAAAPVLASAVLGFLLLVTPVAFAARTATGSASFLPGSGPLNLYIGNSEDLCTTLTIRPGAEWGELLARPEQAGLTGLGGQQTYFRRQVIDLVRERPSVFSRNLAVKSLRFVSSRELPRNLDPYLWRRWSSILSVLVWKAGPFGFPFGVLFPLAAIGVVWGWRRLGAPVLLFLALYSLAVIAVFVSARYRVPVVPALAVAAAAGGAAVGEMWRARRWKSLAAAGAVALGALLLATLPGPFCEEALPAEADFWRNLGSAQEQRGHKDEARASYERSIEAYARESGEARRPAWEVHLNLGRLEVERGELDAGAAHYRQSAALAPSQGDPLFNLGNLELARGRPAAAVEALTEAARREPALPRVVLQRVKALTAAGRPEEALKLAEEVVRRTPADPEARFALGGLLLNRGRPQEAIRELETALELGATPEIHNELATAWMAMSDPAQAIRHYEAALASKPDYVEALTNLGAVLAMSGRLPEARTRFERAVELRPRDPVARFNLALVYEGLGDQTAAIRELRQVLEIEPGHELARQRLAELEPAG